MSSSGKPYFRALPSKSGIDNDFPDITRQLRSRRSGPPLPGCDCMQCFGYCLINSDVQLRELMSARDEASALRRDIGIPGFTMGGA